MELDFSLTPIRSAPKGKNLSKRNKQKQESSNCRTETAEKKTSIRSLTRKKKYQNSMNEDIVTKHKGILDIINITELLNSDDTNKSVSIDIPNRSSDKTVFKDFANRLLEETESISTEIEEEIENKENLSPITKDILVMNTNESFKNKKSNECSVNLKTRLSSNSSIGNKNCSSSSTEASEFVDLKKVAIRRHQFDYYKNCIRNDKLYFSCRKKNVVKENNKSLIESNICNTNDISLSSVNGETNSEVLENSLKGILKRTGISKSISDRMCRRSINEDNQLNGTPKSVKSDLDCSVNNLNNSLKNSTNGDQCSFNFVANSTPKGIKRSITVARNGFKKSEISFNSTDTKYFQSCKKKEDGDLTVDEDCSFKSVVSETDENGNNNSVSSVNKKIFVQSNSRLSGVSAHSSNDDDDSFVSISFKPKSTKSDLRNGEKFDKKLSDNTKLSKNVTKNYDSCSDIFNSSSKRKMSVADSGNLRQYNVTEQVPINESHTKLNLKDSKIKSVCRSDSKTLKNVSFNSSVDFENSVIDSSTPQVRRRQLQCGYRRNLKSHVKLGLADELSENGQQERLNVVPLSLPLPSYESPLLSKSKVHDITKWLSETEKCKNKNSFENLNDKDDEELSVSPPLFNKKFKSSHYMPSVSSEYKIKSKDVSTPEPSELADRIRKPLTEPNKVNTSSKSKQKSVQKRRFGKNGRKKLNFSSDSDDTDNPAARILDQLYGQSWQALNVLPATEPRNRRQKPVPVSQPPMTERKKKPSLFSSSSSSDDHFEEYLEKERLKRLESTLKRSQLTKINESSFIDKTLSDYDNSITLYHKVIASDIKKDVDAASDSKWSGSSHISPHKHARRLSFSSNRSSENTDNTGTKTTISSEGSKKCKKKSVVKVIKKRIPINTSHHRSFDSSGKKKHKKINKRKIRKKIKPGELNNSKEVSVIDLTGSIDLSSKKVIEPATPKVIKESSKQLDTADSAAKDNVQQTPVAKPNAVFPVTPRHTLSFLSSLSVVTANLRCHPDALAYKKNYKTKKEELCKKLFMLYNKEVFESKLPNDMLIQWNGRMRSTSGFCYNRRMIKSSGEVQRSSRITLSSKILDTPDRLRDTLIHEMCHAATWIINGVSHGHGPTWKSWAEKAMYRFPELPIIKRCHDYDIKTKFTYRCTSCGYSFGRHSKSLNTERKRCGYCHGKFELLVSVKEKPQGNGRGGATPLSSVYSDTNVRTPKPVTGFALFVKQNYGEVKKLNSSLPHRDIMKLLGQKFSEFKVSQSNKKETISDK